MGPAARLLAACLALVAFGAVITEYLLMDPARPGLGDPVSRLWVLLRYFTILSNLLLGGVMLAVALGRRPGPDWLATATLAIGMVGLIYHTLLQQNLVGLAWWNDHALHTVTPLGAAIWWLGFGGHGLSLSRLWVWLCWPFGYCLYAMGRGQIDGIYPYFFLDIGRYGVTQVALNIGGLVAAFALAGIALWLIARILGRAQA